MQNIILGIAWFAAGFGLGTVLNHLAPAQLLLATVVPALPISTVIYLLVRFITSKLRHEEVIEAPEYTSTILSINDNYSRYKRH